MDDGSKTDTMSEQVIIPSGCVALQPLIAKLGHNVEEIRVRALKNILFKLDHKLICAADLVHERQLLIKLLEWFNFPNCVLKKEVLGILETLSKPISGAENLLSIGAVEFLSHLRQNVDPELYQSIDSVIYQLLSLPQNDAQNHEQWCLYKTHQPVEVEQVNGSDQQASNLGTYGQSSSVHKGNRVQDNPVITHTQSASVRIDNHSLPSWSHIAAAGGHFDKQSALTTNAPSIIHTQSSHITNSYGNESAEVSNKSCLSFFQWILLSASDRHILSVTASRLQSRSPSLLSKSCEFLMDVLFKDFPAEIFLHRPSVLKALLDLLEDNVCDNKDSSLILGSMKCLCAYCWHLHVRLMAVPDPAVFCPDQDCWKYRHLALLGDTKDQASEQVTAVRETGDGGVDSDDQSGSLSDNRASTISDEDEDGIITEALQFNQLSVEEFCITVLSQVVPIFQESLFTNSGITETAVILLHEVLRLLRRVLPLNIWQDGTKSNSLLATPLKKIMKNLGESIMHHIKQYTVGKAEEGRISSSRQRLQLPIHRMTVINLTSFLVQFLDSIVSMDVAPKVVPPEVTTVVLFLFMDELLALTHGHLRPILMKYLMVLDPNAHSLGLFAQDTCQAIVNTCKFMKACRIKDKQSLKQLLDLAEKSVIGITYHKHMEFISEALEFCSRICNPINQGDNQAISTGHKITVQLLAHPDADIRLQAYRVCLRLLRNAFSVSHVTEPLSTVCQRAIFLLDRAVLHQICCFGIYDEVKKVNSVAVETITVLLLGRLSMSGEMWKQLLDGLIASIPHLQGCMDADPALSQSILELVASHGVTGGHVTAEGDIVTLPSLERFRGSLRLMFVGDPKVRSKAFENVVWNLTKEASSEKKQSFLSGFLMENVADLFIVDQITTALHSHDPVSHKTVDQQELHKLCSILSSSSLDVALRKSSAQHLAIILQDPQWHGPLLEEHSDEVCLSLLKEILDKDAHLHSLTTPCARVELIPPCLTILRLLVQYNVPCRHKLAQQFFSYSVIIRCGLLCHPNGRAKYEAGCLMALLLFDEAAVVVPDSVDKTPFSLPRSLVKRYQLPFTPPVHTPISVHQVPGVQDSLSTEPAVSMLRMAWNLGWHENIENLLRVKGVEDTGQTVKDLGYWPPLQWRVVDAELLGCSHVPSALVDQLQHMETAATHYDVKVSLSWIVTHLLVDKGGIQTAKQRLSTQVLFSLKWENAFERYLQVVPNSSEDDSLLIEVLKVLDIALSSPRIPPEPVVAWVARTVLQRDGPQMTLLRNVQTSNTGSQTVSESKRALRKHLLSFLLTLVKSLSHYTKNWRLGEERMFVGDLAHALALNLDLADNPQFYDLPVLETSLICLAHITAQPHWSLYCKATQGMSLCIQLLTSLVQVVLAFHAGRLGASLSFMGKGVTYYASLCLVHLTHEMAVIHDPDQTWVSHWVQQQEPTGEPLPWLVPLLTDRWPEVRWMGLAICTSLAHSALGREELERAGQRFVGGVWNVAFSVLLDDMECGLVRQQAALLLCSLTSGLVPTHTPAEVHSPQKNSSMSVQALLAFLEHVTFFHKLSTMLSNGSLPMTVPQGTSKACQSSATLSLSSGSNTDIPYKPLRSASWSGSVSSEAQNTTVDSANGNASPGGVSGMSHTTSTLLSSVSSSVAETQPSRTTSIVPLIIERGLPSGMSRTSSSGDTGAGSLNGSSTQSGSSGVPTVKSSITAALIGAVIQLVHNLVLLSPERIMTAVNKAQIMRNIILHVECSDVLRYLSDNSTGSVCLSGTARVVISQILSMYNHIMALLNSATLLDTTFCFSLLQDNDALHRIVFLLALYSPGEDEVLGNRVHTVWESVSKLLVTLLLKQGQLSVPSNVEETLYSHWIHFMNVFKSSMIEDKLPSLSSPRNSLLKLLSLLLTAEGKRHSTGRSLSKDGHMKKPTRNHLIVILDSNTESHCALDSEERTSIPPQCSESPGSTLCSVLLKCYDGAYTQGTAVMDEERALVTLALSSLLGVSQSAKKTALQAGLIQTTLKQIKHLHVQLNMNSLQIGKASSWRKKDDPLTTELIKVLQLLRNFAFCCSQVKAACLECNIVDILHKLWSWCTVEPFLLLEVLRLLCTLTAQFTKASSFLAGSSAGPGSVSRVAQSGSTFLHGLIKLANKTNSKLQNSSVPELEQHLQTHKAVFGLLSNLALSSECRGVMWKTNFLQPFSSFKPLQSSSHPKQRSASRNMILSWLSLLVNVTFFTDGQQGVVKTRGAIEVLLELCTIQHKQIQDKALLVLRNLCFHSASKPLLLANEKLLSLLVDSIADSSSYIRALSVSALCSLLFNCQKAKVSLKKTGIARKVEEAKLQTANEQFIDEDKYNKICQECLQTLQKVLFDHR